MADVTEEQVIEVLKTCYAPYVPLNLYDLGLIYNIDIQDGKVFLTMTLTAPGYPIAGTACEEIENRMLEIEGINDSHIEIVREPQWTPEMLKPEAKELILAWSRLV